MKPHAVTPPSSKRRWKGFATAVLALVFFSLLVPLAFLLGVHGRFPSSSGTLTDERSNQDSGFAGGGDNGAAVHDPPSGQSRTVDGLIRKIGETLPKDFEITTSTINKNTSYSQFNQDDDMQLNGHRENSSSLYKDFSSPKKVPPKLIPSSPSNEDKIGVHKNISGEETKKPCELEFGSYCLWSIEHKEEMKDSMVKKLKDQLFVARAYYPSIAKLQSQENFSRDMKQNIQEHERMLSEAIVDADLPSFAGMKMEKMEQTISKAKSFNVECSNVDRKLRQILDLTDDEAHFHRRQSAFLYHVNVETMPKSLHCLSMRLTVEYFRNSPTELDVPDSDKFESPALHHYVIFSKNVLAASVTINSTVMNSKESENLVFHLLTDEQNYFAMKFWFLKNSYRDASIRVLNIEDLDIKNPENLGIPQFSLSEEFRVSTRNNIDQPSQMKTEYISTFGYSHFLLPDIFKSLKKVILLDDDIVVRHDLTPLWSLNLQDKVIGGFQLCNVRLGQLKSYLETSVYDDNLCLWMSGLNIVNLEKWREHNIGRKYEKLLREMKARNEASWRMNLLRISLLSFGDLTYPLEDSWVFSGLGNNYGTSANEIKDSAVLHYNGNMKPWLELGIPEYKPYWRRHLKRGDQYMDECNANL